MSSQNWTGYQGTQVMGSLNVKEGSQGEDQEGGGRTGVTCPGRGSGGMLEVLVQALPQLCHLRRCYYLHVPPLALKGTVCPYILTGCSFLSQALNKLLCM